MNRSCLITRIWYFALLFEGWLLGRLVGRSVACFGMVGGCAFSLVDNEVLVLLE